MKEKTNDVDCRFLLLFCFVFWGSGGLFLSPENERDFFLGGLCQESKFRRRFRFGVFSSHQKKKPQFRNSWPKKKQQQKSSGFQICRLTYFFTSYRLRFHWLIPPPAVIENNDNHKTKKKGSETFVFVFVFFSLRKRDLNDDNRN